MSQGNLVGPSYGSYSNVPFTRKNKKELLEESKKNQYGIKTLKLIEEFKANLIKEVWSIVDNWINKGKKPSILVGFRFFDDILDLKQIIRKREEIKKEYNDLTKQELLELDSIFEQALNLENVDKEGFDVEDFIERTKLMISVNSEYIIYLASLKK
jgi:hypothetical protein